MLHDVALSECTGVLSASMYLLYVSYLSTSACNVLVIEIDVFGVYPMYAETFSVVSLCTASIRHWSVFAVFSVLSLATSAMQPRP